MEHKINLQMNRIKAIFLSLVLFTLLSGCSNSDLVDVNMNIPENGWAYANKLKASVEVKDSTATYNVFFKMRNKADYRYSNIFLIARLSGTDFAKSDRYQYQLAKADGKWMGKGSGDLYSSDFLLLSGFRFPKVGKYEIEVEQNMRDNPLMGISDVGLKVEKIKPLKKGQ